MKLRAVVFGALVIAATVAVPAAAEEGIHVSPGRRTTTAATRSRSGTATCWSTAFRPPGLDRRYCAQSRKDRLPAERHPPVRLAAYSDISTAPSPTCGPATGRPTGPSRSAGGRCGSGGIVGRSATSPSRPEGGTQQPLVATRGTPASTWIIASWRVSAPAAVRRAPWPHLLQRDAPHEGPRAVGEQRHRRGHPCREGHPAGRARLVSQGASHRTAPVSASPRTTAPAGDGG